MKRVDFCAKRLKIDFPHCNIGQGINQTVTFEGSRKDADLPSSSDETNVVPGILLEKGITFHQGSSSSGFDEFGGSLKKGSGSSFSNSGDECQRCHAWEGEHCIDKRPCVFCNFTNPCKVIWATKENNNNLTFQKIKLTNKFVLIFFSLFCKDDRSRCSRKGVCTYFRGAGNKYFKITIQRRE